MCSALKMHRGTFSVVSIPCLSNLVLFSYFHHAVDGLSLMFVGIGLICVPLTVAIYTIINKRRAKIIEELGGSAGLGKKFSAKELREMGDGAPDFVYTL